MRIVKINIIVGVISILMSFMLIVILLSNTVQDWIDDRILLENIHSTYWEFLGRNTLIEHNIDGNRIIEFEMFKNQFSDLRQSDFSVFENNIMEYKNNYDECIINFMDGTGICYDFCKGLSGIYGSIDKSFHLQTPIVNLTSVDDIKNNYAYEVEAVRNSLSYINNIHNYLYAINDKRFCIFISVKDDASTSMDIDLINDFKHLGIKYDFDEFRESYSAVIIPGIQCYEENAKEKVEIQGVIDDMEYLVVSKGGLMEDSGSAIFFNGIDYSMNQRGINFVIYDMNKHEIVDSVSFDTFSNNQASSRR